MSDKQQLPLFDLPESTTTSDAPSTETTKSEQPGQTRISPCAAHAFQLDFEDYDPEWANKLEKKYGIAKPYAAD